MARLAFANVKLSSILNRKTALLVCGAAWLFLTLPSMSQEAGLRGAVAENSATEETSPLKKKAKKKKADANIPLPRYTPENSNGLVDGLSDVPDAGTTSSGPDSGISVFPATKPETDDPSNQTGSVLSSEVPVPGANQPLLSDDEPDTIKRAERDNLRELAIEGQDKAVEDDPYAAPGIAAGTFSIRPTLDTGIRWTSNSDSSNNGKPSFLSETNLRLRADSNWSSHRLGLETTGSWRKSFSGAETNDPEGGLAADFQFDFSDRTALTGTFGWNHSIEAASAPATVVGALTRPALNRLTGSLGVSHDLGLIGVRAKLNADRLTYGNATDAVGTTVSQTDRNNNFVSLTLRAGYEVSAAISPFVEGEIGRRIYDNSVDSFGLSRSATRYAIRAGVEADLGEKLKGDIAIGYLVENIDDSALEDIAGLSLSGNLNWSPMRGTNVALGAKTSVESSSSATSSGSLLHGLTLALTHKARDNLDLNANLGASLRDYTGPNPNEITLSAGAGFTYWFNRYTGLNSRIAHETVSSSDATRKSQTNSIYVGVTLRR